jgi:DNA adenine methylase
MESGMKSAKPFLKWPGGKTKLITQLRKHLPKDLLNGHVNTYVEPFLGGGSMFYFLKQHFSG